MDAGCREVCAGASFGCGERCGRLGGRRAGVGQRGCAAARGASLGMGRAAVAGIVPLAAGLAAGCAGPPGGADARSVVARSVHRGGARPSRGGRAAPVAAGGASSGGGGLGLFRFYERSSGRA